MYGKRGMEFLRLLLYNVCVASRQEPVSRHVRQARHGVSASLAVQCLCCFQARASFTSCTASEAWSFWVSCCTMSVLLPGKSQFHVMYRKRGMEFLGLLLYNVCVASRQEPVSRHVPQARHGVSGSLAVQCLCCFQARASFTSCTASAAWSFWVSCCTMSVLLPGKS